MKNGALKAPAISFEWCHVCLYLKEVCSKVHKTVHLKRRLFLLSGVSLAVFEGHLQQNTQNGALQAPALSFNLSGVVFEGCLQQSI